MLLPSVRKAAENLTKSLRRFQVKFVEVAFQSLDGETRSRLFKIDRISNLLDGFRVDGFSTGFKPVEDSDLVVVPDPSSLKVYCIEGSCFGFLTGDLFYGDKPFEHCPRKLLRDLLAKSPAEISIGLELEFYLLEGGKPIDSRGYWAPESRGVDLLLEVANSVKSGVEIYSLHHEVGPGQYEVHSLSSDPLTAADNAVFVKHLVKRVALARGLTATFMAKPFSSLPGSGMHIHVDAKVRGHPFFEDGELREEGMNFIGGLLSHAKVFSAFTNQTANSFKRLVPGMEAPVFVSWGIGNRSTLVRVPRTRRRAAGTIEYRLPDASGNIYLAVAATLLAGLRGVEERADPGPPLPASAYTTEGLTRVPPNLGEALEELRTAYIPSALPQGFLDTYYQVKIREWNEYLQHCSGSCHDVTAWELERYISR